MKKHAGIGYILLSVFAAIIGIYLREYRHLAAFVVVVAGAFAILEWLRARRDADYQRDTLLHLARSVSPAPWWKKRVEEKVIDCARTEGYALWRCTLSVLMENGEVDVRVYAFSEPSRPGHATGFLALSDADFSDLSVTARRKLDSAIHTRLFSNLRQVIDQSQDDAHGVAVYATQILVPLYALSRGKRSLPNATRHATNSEEDVVIIFADHRIVLDPETRESLLQLPTIEAGLRIARMLADNDPSVAEFLSHLASPTDRRQ